MSLFKQLNPKHELSPKASEPLTTKPYVSFPKSVSSQENLSCPQVQAPQFCNAISLKTMDNNLLLQFGFINTTTQPATSRLSLSNTAVIVNSDIAKQLFCALAELFDCEIRPKS